MSLVRDNANQTIQGGLRMGTTQQINVAAAATTSTALSATMVRLAATAPCRIRISQAGTAAQATDALLPAGIVEWQGCTIGDKISVIRDSYDGIITITEMV